MNYTIAPHGAALVIELAGETWGTLQETQLKSEVTAAVAMGRRRFVIDLTRVGFITSMGLGVIVACWATIRGAEGKLSVHGANARVASVMAVSRVNEVLDIRGSREEALAAVG